MFSFSLLALRAIVQLLVLLLHTRSRGLELWPPRLSNQPAWMPRQPKLRSSCDGCGSAKLKCDRGQPECGRCLSHSLECVYGVSQKMGKPPRDRVRIPEAPSESRTSGEHSGIHGRARENSDSSGAGSFDCNLNSIILILDRLRASNDIFHRYKPP